ncbi:MAG: EVE domain-containing protein [Pseudomonadota bacterium]
MGYWLMKSEPDEFGIDDLEACKDGTEPWDGIRNYQARNFIRDAMEIGDSVLFYHSNCKEPGVVGIAEIVSEPYPDPTQFDPEDKHYDPKSDPDNPRWLLRDVKFVRKLKRTIGLKELKGYPELTEFRLVQRGNRLSIMPVDEAHWTFILDQE